LWNESKQTAPCGQVDERLTIRPVPIDAVGLKDRQLYGRGARFRIGRLGRKTAGALARIDRGFSASTPLSLQVGRHAN
jgi:hypothetical protein